MDSKNWIKKFIALVMVSVIVLSAAGCSDFFISLNRRKANKCAESFIEATDKGLLAALQEYSWEEIKGTELFDKQEELFEDYSNCSFEIVSIELTDEENKDKALCKVKITYKNFGKILEDMPTGTIDDYNRKLKKRKKTEENVKLKMRSVDGEWKFDDLTYLYEQLYKPYSDVVLLDNLGVALNPNADYYELKCVSCLWYDPILSIPLEGTSVTTPLALQAAFYFDKPVTDKFEAKLFDANGKEIASKEIELEVSVIAICDFSRESVGVQKFAVGEYSISLYYDGVEIASTSSNLTVK